MGGFLFYCKTTDKKCRLRVFGNVNQMACMFEQNQSAGVGEWRGRTGLVSAVLCLYNMVRLAMDSCATVNPIGTFSRYHAVVHLIPTTAAAATTPTAGVASAVGASIIRTAAKAIIKRTVKIKVKVKTIGHVN